MIVADVNGNGKVNYHGRTLLGGGVRGRCARTIEEPLSDQEGNDMMVEADVLRGPSYRTRSQFANVRNCHVSR